MEQSLLEAACQTGPMTRCAVDVHDLRSICGSGGEHWILGVRPIPFRRLRRTI